MLTFESDTKWDIMYVSQNNIGKENIYKLFKNSLNLIMNSIPFFFNNDF